MWRQGKREQRGKRQFINKTGKREFVAFTIDRSSSANSAKQRQIFLRISKRHIIRLGRIFHLVVPSRSRCIRMHWILFPWRLRHSNFPQVLQCCLQKSVIFQTGFICRRSVVSRQNRGRGILTVNLVFAVGYKPWHRRPIGPFHFTTRTRTE
jgi:hypothetical protein